MSAVKRGTRALYPVRISACEPGASAICFDTLVAPESSAVIDVTSERSMPATIAAKVWRTRRLRDLRGIAFDGFEHGRGDVLGTARSRALRKHDLRVREHPCVTNEAREHGRHADAGAVEIFTQSEREAAHPELVAEYMLVPGAATLPEIDEMKTI